MPAAKMAKFGEAMRGLTVFISDIRNCKLKERGGDAYHNATCVTGITVCRRLCVFVQRMY